MAYERKDGDGTLFKNDRKEKETHADYQGSILINGVDYWLNAWIKDGKNGKFMSLSARPKQERAREIMHEQGMYDRDRGTTAADLDDDLPF